MNKENLKYHYRILRSIGGSVLNLNPAKGLKIIGVTGTSGKSTTSAMIYHILKESGIKVGLISTVGAKVGDKNLDTGFHVTTPDPIQLQNLLGFMKKNGAEYVVLETSSHALAQGRLGLLKFDFAVFTNIKSDHLDWHGNWQNYADSKFKLAEKLKKYGTLIINKEDEKSYDFIKSRIERIDPKDKKIIEYSVEESDISEVQQDLTGIAFRFDGNKTHLDLLGTYNLSNFLAAANVAKVIGVSTYKIAQAIKTFEGLTGRMEIIQTEPFSVIVDFAHNADSLENSLKTVNEFKELNSKLITVFGSAGLRDKQKRFDMGKVAADLADIIVITAEDPRTESLYNINSKIIEGAESSGAKVAERFGSHKEYIGFMSELGLNTQLQKYSDESVSESLAIGLKSIFCFDYPEVQNRFDAIELAIKLAQPKDIVITEGKGHEQSLAFGTTEYLFSDQEAVKKVLK